MDTQPEALDNRVLIVAPSGHDAKNAAQVLSRDAIITCEFPDINQACLEAARGVGCLLFTQECLSTKGLQYLRQFIEGQPPWSDTPIVVLGSGTEANTPFLSAVKNLGNSTTVTVLERPLRVLTLISAVKTALRARNRQYQVRDLLAQRETILSDLRARATILETSQRELLIAKEKISSHAIELERTVADRTSRLRETVSQLEAFSYSISHDMRGPLRAMQQYSQILLEEHRGNLDPQAADYLERIARGSQRLDRLIQDVLTYSRVARNAMPIMPVDLDKLVRDIVQQYPAFQPPRADVRLVSPLPHVMGNEASLTQCISNLLGNAVKFVRKGEKPEVKIYPGNVNGSVEICFEDNGIGIAPENQRRIFNIFERIHHEHEYEGTGIGLSIVKKTVERMGGDVGVESDIGQGSKFWIKLQPVEATSKEPEP